jgi:hypothetical protein
MEMVLSTLATQTLTGIDGSQDDADAPRVDMMTGIEESQDDAESTQMPQITASLPMAGLRL